MQGEEIIGFVLQQGGTDVFGLSFYFAKFNRLVQFVGKDDVDFMPAFPVPKVPDVGVPAAFAGFLTEIAFQYDARESRVVAQERLFEQFDAARLDIAHVFMEETEPERSCASPHVLQIQSHAASASRFHGRRISCYLVLAEMNSNRYYRNRCCYLFCKGTNFF